MGMEIPIGPTCGWEWEKIFVYGNSHVEIPCECCGNPMGIPTEILWEWDGNENSLPTATLIYIQ